MEHKHPSAQLSASDLQFNWGGAVANDSVAYLGHVRRWKNDKVLSPLILDSTLSYG